jgi:lysophospholipid acyltransferase (LPLAT)-like uncharacterized protein
MNAADSPAPMPADSSHARTTRGVVVPHAANRSQRLAARVAYLLEQMLTCSLRVEWRGHTELFRGSRPQPVIFCLWHNRLALSMTMYRKGPQRWQPERRLAAMVSASKDGALLARVLQNFGVQPVRGSTSRRGPQALLELTSWAEQGFDLAITPDGPRGPRYQVQDGILALAQLTGLPIVAASYYTPWKVSAKSWDRFQVPLPFAPCTVSFAAPLTIEREASDIRRQAVRSELERRLREISRD